MAKARNRTHATVFCLLVSTACAEGTSSLTDTDRLTESNAGSTSGSGGEQALAGGSSGAGVTAGTAGSAASNVGGSFDAGGSPTAGSSSGGTSGGAQLMGGASGSATAGASAMGGTSIGGGGTTGNAGMAGSSAGMAGSGGTAGASPCTAQPLTPMTSWTATASSSNNGDPPSHAIDGRVDDRWSNGMQQSSADWLQIDFGAKVAIDQATLVLGVGNPDDWPRVYTVRFSDTSNDFAAPVLLTGSGKKATDTVLQFPAPVVGRYLLIAQTGTAPALFWSVAEVTVVCK
jgi:hypothetical protein